MPMGCGNGVDAVAFFIAYTMVVTFVMMNVFIAVILEQFATISAKVRRCR